jgi:hypothetical protein
VPDTLTCPVCGAEVGNRKTYGYGTLVLPHPPVAGKKPECPSLLTFESETLRARLDEVARMQAARGPEK